MAGVVPPLFAHKRNCYNNPMSHAVEDKPVQPDSVSGGIAAPPAPPETVTPPVEAKLEKTLEPVAVSGNTMPVKDAVAGKRYGVVKGVNGLTVEVMWIGEAPLPRELLYLEQDKDALIEVRSFNAKSHAV